MADEPIPPKPSTSAASASAADERIPSELEQDAKGVLGGILASLGCLGFISLPLLLIGAVFAFVFLLWAITELYKVFFG